MKVVYNRFIPFKGFKYFNLYGVLFTRSKDVKILPREYNHEAIHTAQMRDFCKWLPIGGTIFYIVYFLEWLFDVITPPAGAYKTVTFEQEAFAHQYDYNYLKTRPRFAMWRKKK